VAVPCVRRGEEGRGGRCLRRRGKDGRWGGIESFVLEQSSMNWDECGVREREREAWKVSRNLHQMKIMCGQMKLLYCNGTGDVKLRKQYDVGQWYWTSFFLSVCTR
jgi:hypothetical protein